MTHFSNIAVLGRQPELGLMELESLIGAASMDTFGRQTALFNGDVDIARLGGSVKIGRVICELSGMSLNEALVHEDVLSSLMGARPGGGKMTFGISVYGKRSTGEALAAGRLVKQKMKELGQSSIRFVAPARGQSVLSAAQVRHNQLISKGLEILVVFAGARTLVAFTTAVQDIDWYSRRDYGRPARSAKVGMLPPKLAQVLLNATSAAEVCDPFCGTGVVLQEALLAGRRAIGSDLALAMVEASRDNLTWLSDQVARSLPSWTVSQGDARLVTLPAGCSVVSEGYLGEHLEHFPTDEELAKLRQELKELYRLALSNWARQLSAGSDVSLCAPAWRTKRGWQYLDLVDELDDLGYTLKRFTHVSMPLLYARTDQVVGRQLLLLRKT